MSEAKPPKRWSNKWPESTIPDGTMSGKISDLEMLARLGTICFTWPHVEEGMIRILADLLPGEGLVSTTPTARHIFRAIANQQARISVMRTLLERGAQNRGKTERYDRILEEFGKTNDLRNRYVHGLWYTSEDGRTFLQSADADDHGLLRARHVSVKELDNFLERLGLLAGEIYFGF